MRIISLYKNEIGCYHMGKNEDMTPYLLEESYKRLEGTYSLNLQVSLA
jgi:hypothetical protein